MTAKTKKARKRSEKARMTMIGRGVVPLLIGCIVLLADIASKYYIHHFIPLMSHETQWYPYRGIGIFENVLGIEFSLVHATNRGAAWGMLAEFQDYLLIFRILFISGLFLYLAFFNKNRLMVIPLTLIISGALGNILDYFIYGHVVDMLHFVFWGYGYPVFNLADSSIFIGICGIILVSLLKNKNKPSRSKA